MGEFKIQKYNNYQLVTKMRYKMAQLAYIGLMVCCCWSLIFLRYRFSAVSHYFGSLSLRISSDRFQSRFWLLARLPFYSHAGSAIVSFVLVILQSFLYYTILLSGILSYFRLSVLALLSIPYARVGRIYTFFYPLLKCSFSRFCHCWSLILLL